MLSWLLPRSIRTHCMNSTVAYIAAPKATMAWNGQCGQRIMLLIRCEAKIASDAVSQAMAANSSALTKVRTTGMKRSRGFSSGRSKMSTATWLPTQPQ